MSYTNNSSNDLKKQHSSLEIKGILLAIFGAVLWGVSGTFGQFLFQNRGVNVEWMITVRMLSAGFLLLCFAAFDKKNAIWDPWKNKKDVFQLLIFSIVGMLAIQYTYFLTIKLSNAATATVLQYINPIFIVLYLAIRNKRFPSTIELIAVSLAILGTFLLVTHGDIRNLIISKEAFWMAIASAIAAAIYTLQPATLLKRYSAKLIVGWGMFIGGLVMSFFKAPWDITGNWDIQAVYYAFFIVFLGTLLPFYAYLSAVKILGGQTTSLLSCTEPLAAAFMAVLWLNVSFTSLDWLGTACILSTIVLLSFANKRI